MQEFPCHTEGNLRVLHIRERQDLFLFHARDIFRHEKAFIGCKPFEQCLIKGNRGRNKVG